jgi:hypothetical protein
MNDRPRAPELLSIAQEALAAEILPALPERLRYTALMVANAMGIARREIETGEAAANAELHRLQALFSERQHRSAAETNGPMSRSGGITGSAPALIEALDGYNRRLADDIRAGRFDGEERAVLLEHLRRTTEEKLAVSNPKLLNRKR